MHSIWHLPELLVHILLHLEEDDLTRCYHVSLHWRRTLKNNLPPRLRALPDHAFSGISALVHPSTPLPNNIRTLAASIESQDEQWTSLANMICLGDDYLFWREGTLDMMLEYLKPYLHPFLSANAWQLISGFDALAQGNMGIGLQTQCSVTEFLRLDDDGSSRSRDMALTHPPVQSVDLYCMKGAVWDLTNRSVLLREGPTRPSHCVRIERKKGVRMCDVLDELRDVLRPELDCATDQEMVLDWRFGRSDSGRQ